MFRVYNTICILTGKEDKYIDIDEVYVPYT